MSETPDTSKHYVDNEAFQAAMCERRLLVDAAKEAGAEKPQVSEYIGKQIWLIATHLAYKPNFIGYSYREEMVSDGIENCLRYIDNYDCYKYFKPFAYFTQVNYYAFVRRITKEHKQAAVKAKLIREIPFSAFDLQAHDETGDFTNAFLEFLQQNDNTDTSAFDKKKPKRIKKDKGPSLSEFVDEPVEDIIEDLDMLPPELIEDIDDSDD